MCLSGDALFYGSSVRQNLDRIRSMLGVCPQVSGQMDRQTSTSHVHVFISLLLLLLPFQHDVLWNDLTAREHMLLFAGMKGVVKDKREEEIAALLERVQLNHVRERGHCTRVLIRHVYLSVCLFVRLLITVCGHLVVV